MSYQVLARKWRPRSFASLVGQEHVVRALTHALSAGRLHHAYLFTGTRGVGKTTLARILAKALNCESGISANPCGQCSTCQEIDSGRFIDLLEVDAATNTRVDEMRQLLENAIYAPTRGRFKVYVIDEVHMLSTSAFNAMLKTLEEPPEHVKFILATTDPQKIPVTVLSRCLQFNLKQMTPAMIAAHLKHILDIEGIAAESAALQLLARSASGSMRDALSLLDQAIAHGAGRVEEALVRTMLGAIDLDHLFSIVDALLADDAVASLRVAEEMAARSLSFDTALQELAGLLTYLQIAQLAPQALADEHPERPRLLDIAARIDPEFVQLAYQIVVHGRQELALAPDEHAGFVMTLLRLHAFRPVELNDGPPNSVRAASATRPGATQNAAQHQTTEEPLVTAPSSQPASIVPPLSTVVSDDAVKPRATATEQNWHSLLNSLKLSGMARELGQHCQLRDLADGCIVLQLAPAHRHLSIKPAQDKLQHALSEHFGRRMQLLIKIEDIVGDTPAAVAQRDRQERMERAIAAVEEDGFVRGVIDMFDATLIESSIKPV